MGKICVYTQPLFHLFSFSSFHNAWDLEASNPIRRRIEATATVRKLRQERQQQVGVKKGGEGEHLELTLSTGQRTGPRPLRLPVLGHGRGADGQHSHDH